MPANHKVSIGWQIVFTFLPIVNIWAFYRIRRLRKWLLYIVLPSALLIASLLAYVFDLTFKEILANPDASTEAFAQIDELLGPVSIVANLISLGLFAYEIYLIVIWSQQHNQKYDQPSVQSTPPSPSN
jgi:uncharacterized membrane protein YraQ (UPF0718 family)